MFKRLSSAFSSLYTTFSSSIGTLFSGGTLDQETLTLLEKLLLQADTGAQATQKIIQELKKSSQKEPKAALSEILHKLLSQTHYQGDGDILVLVGINGGGKTTSAAKLAALMQKADKKVLLAAADTFRAAAVDQLKLWADRLGVPVISGLAQQDPSAVVYQACAEYKKDNVYDRLIIDTAGRLQTKSHLMKELEKIHRTIAKQLPDKKITTLLVIDSMLGQNSFEQVKLFNESTRLDGIILTKTDGTGKGGIVFNIVDTLKIPIAYITFGEQADQIAPFDSQKFVSSLLNP
jgi:fused signal recognition particle receptor